MSRPAVQREFPCYECNGKCCGPVPISSSRMAKINREIAKLMPTEIGRLSTQERGPWDCGFYDVENRCCSVYEARPELCRVFGRTTVDSLRCPEVTELVTEITPAGCAIRVRNDSRDIALISTDWRFA